MLVPVQIREVERLELSDIRGTIISLGFIPVNGNQMASEDMHGKCYSKGEYH